MSRCCQGKCKAPDDGLEITLSITFNFYFLNGMNGMKIILLRTGVMEWLRTQLGAVVPNFMAPGTCFMEDYFVHSLVTRGWFQDDLSTLDLLHTLFLI